VKIFGLYICNCSVTTTLYNSSHAKVFHTNQRVNTMRFFYRRPEHRSCHGMSRPIQPLCVVKPPCWVRRYKEDYVLVTVSCLFSSFLFRCRCCWLLWYSTPDVRTARPVCSNWRWSEVLLRSVCRYVHAQNPLLLIPSLHVIILRIPLFLALSLVCPNR